MPALLTLLSKIYQYPNIRAKNTPCQITESMTFEVSFDVLFERQNVSGLKESERHSI